MENNVTQTVCGLSHSEVTIFWVFGIMLAIILGTWIYVKIYRRNDYSEGSSFRLFTDRLSQISIGTNKILSNKFNNNKFNRFCGVEIECINKSLSKNQFNKKELNDLNFSQVRDYSLSSGGVEFPSRPANGDKLFSILKDFTSELNKREYFTNTTCGLHIHLEIPNRNDLEYLKKIFVFYKKYEDFFFDMLPKSRQNTGFCHRFKRVYSFGLNEILKTQTIYQFKKVLYGDEGWDIRDKYNGYDDKRYCWVNFHSIFHRGTVEIRSHSGTINYDKIKNWLLIHLTVLKLLENKSIEQILQMGESKKDLLKLFNKDLQKYIQLRWNHFSKVNELETNFLKSETKKEVKQNV